MVFNNELDFYHKGLSFKELKELFIYLKYKEEFKEIISLKKSFLVILLYLFIFSAFISSFFMWLYAAKIAYFDLIILGILSLVLTVVYIYRIYINECKKNMKNFFDYGIEEDKLKLLDYMKKKYSIQENDLLLKDIVIEPPVVIDNSSKKSRRL